ncbi:C-1-tetrahydrofolate synthase, cytoplasmic [Trichinella zimbabwensis]|uniref:C-1-tetrahydrofolate synthase, cytoplasmic n=1 Tax=Trichinella zimbabwensis TaxID=268475 RepID=A0A0V1I868_9BILA|nr:C-1-tetrahydrofolate synthase, cytoplasmic [Trichinella zimbabwensis]
MVISCFMKPAFTMKITTLCPAGIDKCHRFLKKSVRRRAQTDDPFLARRSGSKFNKIVLKRLLMARRHKPPLSLRRLANFMQRKGREDKICVIVGTVTNDVRLYHVPKLEVCALHVTEQARARILKAGGKILTFDQLALRAPKGENTVLVQGKISCCLSNGQDQEKHEKRKNTLVLLQVFLTVIANLMREIRRNETSNDRIIILKYCFFANFAIKSGCPNTVVELSEEQEMSLSAVIFHNRNVPILRTFKRMLFDGGWELKTNQEMAVLIDGKKIASQLRQKIRDHLSTVKRQFPKFNPKLAIVQVGDRQDSNVYIRNKLKAASEIGVSAELIKLSSAIGECELINQIETLNTDPDVHGIIVQLPLDASAEIDAQKVINCINFEKDVDGLTLHNAGRLARGELENTIIPCTPKGCLELLKHTGINISGKHCVVVGRSRIVGGPVSALLLWQNATVTTCHSKTENLAEFCQSADILIVAVGRPNLIQGSWIKPKAVVIDCGINVVEDDERRLVGDVDFESAKQVASFITPVPGGVGPMTVAMLMSNTVDVACRTLKRAESWSLTTYEPVLKSPVPSDLEISHSHKPISIDKLANSIGLLPNEVEQYGKFKAKVSLDVLNRYKEQKNGSYVIVTSMSPPSRGAGKSTVVIGLTQALNVYLKMNSFACLRQPSQGPTFGMKGGAAGGGYSQVVPMDEFNLHLTGDFHAIVAATNLLAAAVEARLFHEATSSTEALYKRLVPVKNGKRAFTSNQLNRLEKLNIQPKHPDQLSAEEREQFSRLNIDSRTITWNRVVDTNDRFLRLVTVGQSPSEKGHSRQCRFDIAAASEITAILALTTGLADLRRRLGRIVVANDVQGRPVCAEDLSVAGALAALMKDSVRPNLMQTLQGTPVFVHSGPFANIAHGNSSILADQIALKLVGQDGVVVTEAGFGADVGFEKFCNIKCRTSGLCADVAVVVVTIEALKLHGGAPEPHLTVQSSAINQQDLLPFVEKGCLNMVRHIENVHKFGTPVIVAVNKYSSDTPAELEIVRKEALKAGALDAVVCEQWEKGGRGCVDLANAVSKAVRKTSTHSLKLLYPDECSIKEKIETIAKEIYGADGVEFTVDAEDALAKLTSQGFHNLPVCMAKTQKSFSNDPNWKGVPSGYKLPVRDVKVCAGAGFLYALVGEIQTMPGLPVRPAFFDIDVDLETEFVKGLF